MNKQLSLVCVLALCAALACSSKDDGENDGDGSSGSGAGSGTAGSGTAGSGTAGSGTAGSGTSGTGTSGTGTAGSGTSGTGSDDGMCVNTGEVNEECPFNLPPITGSCAPHGECCHRTSNIKKVESLEADETAVLEYTLSFVEITNHKDSIGLPDLMRTAQDRATVCSGEQCLLWRFTAPRAGGEFIEGPGKVEIGIGAYNCDGTYSFYGPEAAPDRSDEIGESDPGRWQSVEVDAEVDPAQAGRQRFHIPWATNKNRELQRSIFILPSDNSIDWELASSGFDITEIEWSGDVVDCLGSRNGFIGWNTVSGFESYSPVAGNDRDVANQINQTYCALLGFGLLPEGEKDKDCMATERCMPDGGNYGDGGCDWIKLPDSLCPVDDAEQALFGCHLGAEGNPNGEEGYPDTLNCTAEAPTEPQDPDMGVTTKGQCCDPLGDADADNTLPACNAYRTVGRFVATAAEITDEPRNSLPPMCN